MCNRSVRARGVGVEGARADRHAGALMLQLGEELAGGDAEKVHRARTVTDAEQLAVAAVTITTSSTKRSPNV